MENKNPSPRRPRGAQPGNTNAVKHGFYSRNFHHLEAADLDIALLNNLDDEIALLRIIIRRVFEYTHADDQNSATWSTALGTLGAACIRLSHLLRTQKLLGGEGDKNASAVSQAIADIMKDRGFAQQ
jgi:hypothetical protein